MKRLFAIALLLSAASTFAAYDAFLKLGDIKGESTDNAHKDWIELSSFSMGVTGGSSYSMGATKSSKQVSVKARMGPWASQVSLATANGKHFTNVTLDAGLVRYTFDSVIVSSFSSGGTATGTGPQATFTLAYNNVTMSTLQRPNTTPAAPLAMVAATTVTPNLTLAPTNAQVFVDGVASDRFTLISFDRTLERNGGTGVLRLRNLQGNAYFAANRTKNTKVNVKASAGQFLDIQMTNCTISGFSRNADGTSTATFNFSLYNGPASVRQ